MKIIFVTFFLIFSVYISFASPAQKVILSYDAAKQELSIDAMHKVINEKTHYIKEITIFVNGNKIETKTFKSQTSKTDQIAVITIVVKKDDKITVATVCNLGGNKSQSIVIK